MHTPILKPLTRTLWLLLAISQGALATENPTSPADSSTPATLPPETAQMLVERCQNRLKYASDAEKAELQLKLNGKTCEEAISLFLNDTP